VGSVERDGAGYLRLARAVAVTFDEDWLSVMQKAIQQSGGHGGVTGEDRGQSLKAMLVVMMIEPRS